MARFQGQSSREKERERGKPSDFLPPCLKRDVAFHHILLLETITNSGRVPTLHNTRYAGWDMYQCLEYGVPQNLTGYALALVHTTVLKIQGFILRNVSLGNYVIV